jgi:hypothetical protein
MNDLLVRARCGGFRCHLIALALCGLLSGLGQARAQALAYAGWGIRGGVSSSPDQLVMGGHLDLGDLAQNLRLVPNADLGFGDHFTLLTLNSDVIYSVHLNDAGRLYFGGCLGLVYWRWDAPDRYLSPYGLWITQKTDGTDLGVAGIAGYQLPGRNNPIFVDLKVGITDEYPDLKIMVGYTLQP